LIFSNTRIYSIAIIKHEHCSNELCSANLPTGQGGFPHGDAAMGNKTGIKHTSFSFGGLAAAVIFGCSASAALATPSWPDEGTLICEQQRPSHLTTRMKYSLLDHSGGYEIIAANPLSDVPDWATRGADASDTTRS
jgi:hypothetical protein